MRWRILGILAFLALLSVGLVTLVPRQPSRAGAAEPAPDSLPAGPGIREMPEVETLYGIPLEGYRVHTGRVRRGESLADLLVPYRVTPRQIHRISLLSDSLINERRIRPGHTYGLFLRNDTIPAYFIYEKDPLHFVRIGFSGDSLWAENGTRPRERRIRFASGTIETSLWEAMSEAKVNPILAVELSEIFAWSIDFFGLQAGDRFKVVYEESFVDSLSIGIDRIVGAWFLHNGHEFWGIPFEQDGVVSFFDERGNSLRKAFLKAPLRFSRISSGFSHSRFHPVLKIRRPHHGVDYAAPAGTPVHTVGDGVVTRIGYQRRGGGNYVKIKHNSVYSTTYMHLSRFARGLHQGQVVLQGEVIGYVGSTGLATGPHLDFRFYRNGSAVNPLKVEAPPVEPVYEENLPAYAIRRGMTVGLLKLI